MHDGKIGMDDSFQDEDQTAAEHLQKGGGWSDDRSKNQNFEQNLTDRFMADLTQKLRILREKY